MRKIEHIGIAVRDIDAGEKMYGAIFQSVPYKRERVESEGVVTSFFKCGPNKIELLSPLDDIGPIAKFLTARGEGIHHIAYDVSDIEAEMRRLKAEGFQLTSDEPRKGADNKLVCFVHPKSAAGVLIELCQEIGH